MTKAELPQRKSTRLVNFDYSSGGAYFITICTHNRANILSTIAGEIPTTTVGEGFPLPQLTTRGNIVEKYIKDLPNRYHQISVEEYVIMPNHIHLLLLVSNEDGRGDPSPTIVSAMGWLKYQSTREINKEHNTIGAKIFQRSFYDHIVRDLNDYCEIQKYIVENPLRWKFDKLYVK